MRNAGDHILFSATDLMRFTGCAHATALDLARLRGKGPEPREDDADARLLQTMGDAHEAGHLARLKAQGRHVVEITPGDLATDAAATRAALAEGPDILFQGALLSGNWGGWSDFLERVERPSALGAFSYEVTDTKLKRRPHPRHVLQLVLYSDLLADVQGVLPEQAHIELGDGTRATLRLADYAHYARAARARLEAFVAETPETRPEPCADCSLCRWSDHCAQVWKAEDNLFTLANITRAQVKKLESDGIDSVAQLARHAGPVRGMAAETLDRLKAQARLQQARKSGPPRHELRPARAGKGFDLLPRPQPGDIFYDIEGDPHVDGGLEYLHGVLTEEGFQPFWAHDRAGEGRALAKLFAFFEDRLRCFPNAGIYHYAPYEITALRRLTARHGIGEAFLDRLLRERRFVDLFAVVRGGLICSESSYSIKSLEVFYDFVREGEVKTAGGSVVAYEEWRETGEAAILDEIENYNRLDCLSTQKLRDWLVSIRPEGPWPTAAATTAEDTERDDDVETLRARLQASGLCESRQAMLLNLGVFHKREAKPGWWAIFDSLGMEADELIDDLDALAGLVATGPSEPVRQSMRRTYSFPRQETKLRNGSRASIATPENFTSINIEHLDRKHRTVTLTIGRKKADLLADQLTLHPDAPLDTRGIAQALRDVIEDQCGPRRYRAVDDLLSRAAPRLSGPMPQDADPVLRTIEAVARMEETVLPIQGPPGTGKTHVTARAILALLRSGKRVGVASSSHEAIRNLLTGCTAAIEEADLPFSWEIMHKLSSVDDGYPEDSPILRTTDNARAAVGRHVVGGTVFFFARAENIQAFDWLFVDEAGQVGLANMVAMGRAARNIVLVGDPRQLPQVIQGAHPEPANLSCLDWMLGEHATIPPDRGIFLDSTRRMHPAVNRFISEQVYEGRLASHPDTARQKVSGTGFPEAGAFWVPVAHEGNAQVAQEETSAILAACGQLLAGQWTGMDGTSRPMRPADIIVVAPYNAQVNALAAALPDGIRVGTVDRFQGQEAAVCLVSMTASSAGEMARGMEFLFSLNRINVAISRARALALIFGAPRLREAKCETIEQMRLVNTLCALPGLPAG